MEKYFIGEIIRQKRTELGLKQCQLCEGICEPTTMSRIESGKQMPGLNTLKTYCSDWDYRTNVTMRW